MTDNLRGVSVGDQRVGTVLFANEEIIYEQSQAEQLVKTQVMDNTIGERRRVGIVEGLGSDRVKNESDSNSS